MERRKEHAHITLDPHRIHRLYVIPLPQLEVQEHGGGQHGLLVRERENEEGGARFDFEFSFRRFGKGTYRPSLRLDYSSSLPLLVGSCYILCRRDFWNGLDRRYVRSFLVSWKIITLGMGKV